MKPPRSIQRTLWDSTEWLRTGRVSGTVAFVMVIDKADSTSKLSLGKRLESLEVEETTDVMKEMSMEEKPKALPKTGSLDVILTQIIETNDYDQFAKISISGKQSVCWL